MSQEERREDSVQEMPGSLSLDTRYVGFWRRLGAYLIDVTPILLVMVVIFYVFFGFDAAVADRFSNSRDIGARIRFLEQRNQIREERLERYVNSPIALPPDWRG